VQAGLALFVALYLWRIPSMSKLITEIMVPFYKYPVATGVGLLLHARRHTEETAAVGLRSGRPIGRMLDRMKSWMFEFF